MTALQKNSLPINPSYEALDVKSTKSPSAPTGDSPDFLLKSAYLSCIDKFLPSNMLLTQKSISAPIFGIENMEPQAPPVNDMNGSSSSPSPMAASLSPTGWNPTQEVPVDIRRLSESNTPVPIAADGWSKAPETNLVSLSRRVPSYALWHISPMTLAEGSRTENDFS